MVFCSASPYSKACALSSLLSDTNAITHIYSGKAIKFSKSTMTMSKNNTQKC